MAGGDRQRMTQVMAEIELGLRESHGDVRELLVHFRTRTNEQDMEHALHATLRKFEHQTGLGSTLTVHDDGLPLAPDAQVQALHIVQEALSNVRKHARATHVRVDVWKRPAWRIEVHDDGCGFDGDAVVADAEAHVGLRIMKERAQRLGATLRVRSQVGRGTTVSLELPSPAGDAASAAPAVVPSAGEAAVPRGTAGTPVAAAPAPASLPAPAAVQPFERA
jgi:two-component system nitrate/nitrite sensor histidine kinase NarX